MFSYSQDVLPSLHEKDHENAETCNVNVLNTYYKERVWILLLNMFLFAVTQYYTTVVQEVYKQDRSPDVNFR